LAVTKGVLDFLKDRKQDDAPFFLLADTLRRTSR